MLSPLLASSLRGLWPVTQLLLTLIMPRTIVPTFTLIIFTLFRGTASWDQGKEVYIEVSMSHTQSSAFLCHSVPSTADFGPIKPLYFMDLISLLVGNDIFVSHHGSRDKEGIWIIFFQKNVLTGDFYIKPVFMRKVGLAFCRINV